MSTMTAERLMRPDPEAVAASLAEVEALSRGQHALRLRVESVRERLPVPRRAQPIEFDRLPVPAVKKSKIVAARRTFKRRPLHDEIAAYLRTHPRASSGEVAEAIGRKPGTTQTALSEMWFGGMVTRDLESEYPVMYVYTLRTGVMEGAE